MKPLLTLLILIAAAAFATVAVAQDAPSPAAALQSPADKAYAELQALRSAPFTLMNDRARAERLSPAERRALSDAAGLVAFALAEKFFDDYPADPRRWQAVATMLGARRNFSGDNAIEQQATWQKKREELLGALVAAADVPEQLLASTLEREVYAHSGRRGFGELPKNLARAGEMVELMAKRAPSSDRRRFAERAYLTALEEKEPAAAEALLRKRADEKEINPGLARQAAGMLLAIDGKRTPMELKFTALDGSTVDLANYRGKVVLIDFWATWCVPCMEEMPNVKRVYAAYRDKGFEIIGISLDAAPRDPAKPRKHEKTAEQLKEFLVQESMPWPQHYDGKWWDNEFSRRFAIRSIPAIFLIDQEGKLVTTEAHGPKLEAEVKRLLKL
jgi:thiol-disulfide isomerase/thioredoxin